MYAAVLTVVLTAACGDCGADCGGACDDRSCCLGGCCQQCRTDDCHRCFKTRTSVCKSWNAFFCNLAPPCNCRMSNEPWPLEYPGARARGWQAHGVAVTKDTPINVGPHAALVEMDEHGLPRVIRFDQEPSTGASSLQPLEAEPIAPAAPATDQSRHDVGKSLRATWRFMSKKETTR